MPAQANDKQPEAGPATIREAVINGLGNLGPRTRSAVVEHFAAKEAEKRANALISGLDKLDGLEKELKKIKPSHAGFDEEGQPVGNPTFTKDQVDQRKKLDDQIKKLTSETGADWRQNMGITRRCKLQAHPRVILLTWHRTLLNGVKRVHSPIYQSVSFSDFRSYQFMKVSRRMSC